jgi:hypothetical protein
VTVRSARLIPKCTLTLYDGKGHERGLLSGMQFVRDVMDFVRQRPAARRERGAG